MTRRVLGMVMMVGAGLLAQGCLEPESPEAAATIRVTSTLSHETPAGMEAFLIESDGPEDRLRPPLSDRQMWPHENVVLDPCDCATDACLDSWVDRNLGCDVCVVLYCDEHPAGHVCSDCSASAINAP